MSEDDLFAYARRTDPRTSWDAAESLRDILPEMEFIVLVELRKRKMGGTVDEMVEATGMPKVSVSPRFRPLCERGLVEERVDIYGDTIKRPGASGRNQTVWFAT